MRTKENCRLPSANHHATQKTTGSCIGQYTGSCSYRCNEGSWVDKANSCALPTPPSGCSTPETPTGCNAFPSGGIAHSASANPGCASGYTGTCSVSLYGRNANSQC